MKTNSATRRQHIIAEKEAQIRYENRKQRKRIMLRSVIGLILAVSILLPLVMVSFNSLSAGANQSAIAGSSSTSIDPTKLTKAQRKELLNSDTDKLTDEQKKEFIETGSISGTTTSSSSPSEEVTASPTSSSTAK